MQTEAEVSSISELADIEHYLTKSALAVRKNIRSGQKISYDGTLIIFGDVNAGAELEAAGHILVLGALRGVAHAGCKGDKKAVIYANQLRSVQLRIADLIARAPDGEIKEITAVIIAAAVTDSAQDLITSIFNLLIYLRSPQWATIIFTHRGLQP